MRGPALLAAVAGAVAGVVVAGLVERRRPAPIPPEYGDPLTRLRREREHCVARLARLDREIAAAEDAKP